jgi:glucose-1-phosphate cytidylyltransferase
MKVTKIVEHFARIKSKILWRGRLKIILLAGGLGTRISEETDTKPKPMVLINGKPLLWHLMNIYAKQGFADFIIATGYKGEVISEWVSKLQESWNVKALDTGEETQTGGRIRKCIEAFPDERFMAAYGDGLGNVNISRLLETHKTSPALATLTAVRPPARFGYVKIDGVKVDHFGEKNQADEGWINGGFFVLESAVVNYIENEKEPFETGALPRLAELNQLNAFKHEGFWQPMDTLREKLDLERLATQSPPPWFEGL